MPDLGGGTPQKKNLDLSGTRTRNKAGAASASKDKDTGGRIPTRVTRSNQRKITYEEPDDGDEDEEDDEIIQSSIKANKGSSYDKRLFIIGGVAAVLIVVVLFVLLNKGSKNVDGPAPSQPSTTVTEQPSAAPSENFNDPNVGVQDFTQNTTMTSDSPLSNPDGFVEDINGLTTRVEYEVSSIQNAVDFVNYVKKRGTWGGGLELYWLECTYKGNQYVIQVPFKYYKELDDTGIVPVKMEVLYSKQPTGETLTIISYMCLDENTLKTFLNSKK